MESALSFESDKSFYRTAIEKNWKDAAGNAFTANGNVIVSTSGAAVSQNIGTLVPGKYNLASVTSEGTVTIKVNGTALDAAGNFELKGTSAVSVTIVTESTVAGQKYKIGGFKLELVYDFKTTNTRLTNLLSEVSAKIDPIKETENGKALLLEGSAIAEEIKTIVDDKGIDGYNIYKDFQLYKGTGSTLDSKISAFSTKIDGMVGYEKPYLEATAKIKNLRASLEIFKTTNLSDETAYSYIKYIGTSTDAAGNTSYNAIVNYIAKFESEVKAAYGNKLSNYDINKFEYNYNSYTATLSKNIKKANQDHIDYNEVLTLANAARTAYNTQVTTINSLLAGDTYSDWNAKALAELSVQLQIINSAKVNNGSDDVHDDATKNKVANEKAIKDAAKQMVIIVNTWTANKNAYTTATDVVTALNASFETESDKITAILGLAETDATVKKNLKADIDKVTKAISELSSEIEEKKKAVTIVGYDYSEKETAIKTLITTLKNNSAAPIANYNAYKAMQDAIATLTKNLETNKAEVEKLAYEEFKVSGKYTTVTTLTTEISEYSAEIIKQYTAKTAVSYKSATFDSWNTTSQSTIDSYLTTAEADIKSYEAIQKKIKKFNEDWAALNTLVTNKAVIVASSTKTYGTRLSELTSEITGLNKKLDDALKLQDTKFTDAIKATETSVNTSSISTDISTLSASYATDEKAYNEAQSTAAVDMMLKRANGYVADKTNEIGGMKVTPEDLGNSYTAIKDGYNVIKEMIGQAETEIGDAYSYKTSDPAKAMALLSEIVKRFETGDIKTSIENITVLINTAVAKVTANKEALASLTATKKIADDLLNDKKTGVLAIYKDTKYTQKFSDDVNAINIKFYTLQSNSIDKYDKEEALPEHKTEIEEEIAKLTTEINTLRADATKYAENVTVKESLITTYNAKGYKTLLSAAETAVNATSGTTAYDYYLSEYNKYDKQVNDYLTEINTAYDKIELTKASQAEYESKLSTLVTNLSNLAAYPTVNKANYDILLKSYESTNRFWTEIYNDINANDESSKKGEYLTNLQGYLTELTTCYNKIEADFKVGGIYTETLRQTFAEQITAINTKIKDLKELQSGNYNAAINEDNKNDHKTNTDAITAALSVYYNSIDKLNKYSGIQYQKVELSKIFETHAAIYEYINKLRDLSTAEEKEYTSLTSGVRYNTKAQTTANTYSSEITGKLVDFQTEVNTLIRTKFDTEFNAKYKLYTGALSEISSYATKDKAFLDVKTIINDISIGRTTHDFALNVDKYKTQLDGISELLETGKTTAAEAEWKHQYDAATTKKNTWLEGLNKFDYLEGNTTDFLAQFNSYVSNHYDEAGKLYQKYSAEGTLYTNLSKATAYLTSFLDNGKAVYNSAEAASSDNTTNKENNVKLVTDLDDLKVKLDDAKLFCFNYSTSANLIGTTVKNLYTSIEAQYEKAEHMLKYGGSKDYFEGAEYKTFKDNLETDIKNYYFSATTSEIKEVAAYIETLKKECNTVAINDVQDINKDAIKACQAKIVTFNNEIEDIKGKYPSKLKDSEAQQLLLELENRITIERSTMISIYSSDSITILNTKLTGAVKDLVDSKNNELTYLNTCNQTVKDSYLAKFEKLSTFIEEIKASVETAISSQKALLLEKNITTEIEFAKTNLATISGNIKSAQTVYDINDTKYTELNAELEALSNTLNEKYEIIKTLSTYEDNKIEYNKSKKFILDLIASDQTSLDQAYNNVKLTNASQNANKGDIVSDIQYLYDLARYNDYTSQSKAIEATNKAINIRLNKAGSSFIDKTDLTNRYNSLVSSICYLMTYNSGAKYGYVEADIDGNKFKDDNGNELYGKYVTFDEVAGDIADKINSLKNSVEELNNSATKDEYINGDADLDKNITVNDYNTIKGYIVINKTTIDKFDSKKEFEAAKCNGTGSVINIGDLTKVVNTVLQGQGYVNPSKAEAGKAESKSLFVAPDGSDAITLSAAGEGTTKRIAINLSNSISYVACQMDITLPSGMKLVGESLTNRADGHTLSSSDLEDGTHRIVISSLQNNAFNDSESAIVYLDVEITGKVSSEVEVSNVLFSDADARVFSIGNTDSGNLTGINSIKTEQTIGSRIYDAGGRLLKSLKKGVNIIRKSDGSTEKVIGK